MSSRMVAIVGIALLVAIGAGWFLTTYERVEERVFVGMSGEAETNRLLAAERLATSLGRKVTKPRSLAEISALPEGGTLVLGRFRQSLSKPAIDRVIAWVEAGGFLIVESEDTAMIDPLLDALEVQRSEADRKGVTESALDVTPPGSDKPVKAYLPRRIVLETEDDPAFSLDDAEGSRILGIERGRGRVIVFASFSPIENRSIGAVDNAALYWSLVEWGRNAGEMVFVLRPGKVSVWNWLREHVPQALLAAALLLALWLWRVLVRFGPVAPDPLPARRRLTDHLAATGRFLRRERRTESLVRAEREAALDAMTRAVPGFANAPRAEQVRMIAARIGCPVTEAEALVVGSGADGPHEFVSIVRLAQRIHLADSPRKPTPPRTA